MLTADAIEALLDTGDEARLIGESETEQLDFKEQPHILTSEKGKWELAKDVAALANSGGGCIVVGVSTIVPSDREEEVASAINPFPSTMADVKQIRDSLDAASAVYPVVRGVTIRKFERASGKAMLLIRVPPQSEDDLPFMVVRMVEGDEKRGVGVGVPFRSGPHTYWTPPGQLHRDLSDGQRARKPPPSGHRDAIDGSSTVLSHGLVSTKDLSDERLRAIEQYMGWSDAATLLLAAVPTIPQAEPIDGFYDPNKIYGCVEYPPEIRHAGFSLAWRHQPENIDGSLVNPTAERNILWADPNGAAFAAALGRQSFLTRSGGSRNATEPERRTINPTVLVEWTYLFFNFYAECIRPSVTGRVQLAVRLRGARSREWPMDLVAGVRNDSAWDDAREAGLDDFYFAGDLDEDPAKSAFKALKQIYELFGLSAADIPYTTDDRVDADQIRAI